MKLGDICDVITKGTTPTSLGLKFSDEGINFIKIESISENGNFLEDKFAHISNECHQKLNRSQLKDGDLLFSIAGAIGRTAIVTQDILPANTNQALAIIRLNEKYHKSREIIYMYFNSPLIKIQYSRKKQGVAQLNLSLQDIKLLEMPEISEGRKEEIVRNLKLIQALIDKRKRQLNSIDFLAKSRFIEMFGDPVLNPYGFEVKNMGEVCTFYTGTGFPNVFQGKSDGDFPFYKVGDISKNVQNGFKELEYCDNYINKDVVDKIRGTIIPSGTIVFAKIGEALKLNRRGLTIKNCLVDNNVMGVKPKEELNISYFFQLMKDLDMEKYSASTTVPSVRKTILERIPILVPNLDIQNKYAEFIKQLDKSKFRIKKSLEKLELTYKALLQEYFG